MLYISEKRVKGLYFKHLLHSMQGGTQEQAILGLVTLTIREIAWKNR